MSTPTIFDALTEVDQAAQAAVANRQGPSTFDSPTSWLAAHANRVRSGGQRRRVLEALYRSVDGLTDYEMGARLGLLRTAAGTRRKELAELHLVEDTAETRPTDMGAPAVVHRLTPLGLAVAEEVLRG